MQELVDESALEENAAVAEQAFTSSPATLPGSETASEKLETTPAPPNSDSKADPPNEAEVAPTGQSDDKPIST